MKRLIPFLLVFLICCGPKAPTVDPFGAVNWKVVVSADQGTDAPKAITLLEEFSRVTTCALDAARNTGARPAALPEPGKLATITVMVTGERWTGQPPADVGPWGVKLYAGHHANGTNKPAHVLVGEAGRWLAKRISAEGCGR